MSDENGKAEFEVTFPDDITSWQTFVLAMNDEKQTGQDQDLIKSYKPLMAKLAVPRFLVQNDTSFIIGKSLNYTPDSISIKTEFKVNDSSSFSNNSICVNSILDTLMLVAPKDSLAVTYSLKKGDGYFDGERREIPVFPVGLEETNGEFFVLDTDSDVSITSDRAMGKVKMYARADMLDVLEDEIDHVLHYKYFCNEQITSKLKVLLAQKQIADYKGEKFRQDHEINKLLRLLKKNQIKDGLWGWWKNSEENEWISLYVLETLSMAEDYGFKTFVDKNKIAENAIWHILNTKNVNTRIKYLMILKHYNIRVDFVDFIHKLDSTGTKNFNQLLQLIYLKQLTGVSCNIDTLNQYKKTTLFGNTYFSDENKRLSLVDNDIQNTILAYKILRADTIPHNLELQKIRNYFFEQRKKCYWRNTFESANIIATILPDLKGGHNQLYKSKLFIEGDIKKLVSEFPFEMEFDPGQNLVFSKTGDFPVYVTTYQRYWNPEPKYKADDFVVTSAFSNGSNTLKAGEEIVLNVHVKVKKSAEYVMINIPVPAGCSYAEKYKNSWLETHREYYKNEVAVFCQRMNKGDYDFEVKLIPRYNGKYTLNPAKAELMYFPTFNANEAIKKVTIK
ncbi:alpha-2-macroglobulin family protein [Saccharicrinis sp. FJH54]|uniref:alpha-2-macroglobulin family protein n=1 Tax=Saccharicrinis sp. FJH54 TaxID=3344665 RepID=UPI0035D4CF48